MAADNRPYLVLPPPITEERGRPPGGGKEITLPSPERQHDRLAPRFQQLADAMNERRMRLQADVAGAPSEQVLVLEIAGSVADFVKAVQRIPGAEWLGEVDELLEPDEDFYVDEEHIDQELAGQLFLVMSNLQALDQILSLWQRWTTSPKDRLDRGLAPWKHVFAHLRDIRPWDVQDRISSTGVIEDWRDRLAQGQEVVPAEIELWFRATEEGRQDAADRARGLVEASDGRVLAEAEIEEISYHALLAEIPASLIPSIAEAGDARLVRADDIMFFRPTGQALSPLPEDLPLPAQEHEVGEPAVEGNPLIALFDGLPVANHRLLERRLIVDDPDDWGADYLATDRVHGTSMASLICHGDLGDSEPPVPRPVYMRPIMRPATRALDGGRVEAVPDNELFVDLLHRAVRRLFEPEGEEADAVAPTVRVVNLSICDRALALGRYPTPVARMLDWLSWRYGVLFVVSAGNHTNDFTFATTAAALDALNPLELEALALRSLANDAPHRRLLAPAEAMNALTVAAAHRDAYADALPNHLRNFIRSPRLPSPINASGLGFRRDRQTGSIGGGWPPVVFGHSGRRRFGDLLSNSNQRTPRSTCGFARICCRRAECYSVLARNEQRCCARVTPPHLASRCCSPADARSARGPPGRGSVEGTPRPWRLLG